MVFFLDIQMKTIIYMDRNNKRDLEKHDLTEFIFSDL